MADFVERFGLDATYGRRLTANEIYRMNAALNVYNASMSRKAADDWAKWSQEHQQAAELLTEVERLNHE